MSIEKLNFSPEEKPEIKKERIITEGEFLKNDARYKFDDNNHTMLEVTEKQIQDAHKEMFTDRAILDATILNPNKQERDELFESAWQARFDKKAHRRGYFQTEKSESPFSEYSSKGWKIHIVFRKGEEKMVARLLYENSLYFKIESQNGTYFNGKIASGATIYIGSKENMEAVADLINGALGDVLEDGTPVEINGKKINLGSGTDIEVLPKITARFDVAKTKFGWAEGNGKYTETGFPSWMPNLGGLPILKKHEQEVSKVLNKWNNLMPTQRKIYYDKLFIRIYNESKEELIKDFGEGFVLGKKANKRK